MLCPQTQTLGCVLGLPDLCSVAGADSGFRLWRRSWPSFWGSLFLRLRVNSRDLGNDSQSEDGTQETTWLATLPQF